MRHALLAGVIACVGLTGPQVVAQQTGPAAPPDVGSITAAAEKGDAKAQHLLGHLYFEGKGVPKDGTEAVRWWRRAADQGQPDAQWDIGVVYLYGEGVTPDPEEAGRWFWKAAAQGNAGAKTSLGKLYAKDFTTLACVDERGGVRYVRQGPHMYEAWIPGYSANGASSPGRWGDNECLNEQGACRIRDGWFEGRGDGVIFRLRISDHQFQERVLADVYRGQCRPQTGDPPQ